MGFCSTRASGFSAERHATARIGHQRVPKTPQKCYFEEWKSSSVQFLQRLFGRFAIRFVFQQLLHQLPCPVKLSLLRVNPSQVHITGLILRRHADSIFKRRNRIVLLALLNI